VDRRRFDILARSLTTAGSRRRVMTSLLGLVFGAAMVEEAGGRKKCPPCKKSRQGKCKGKKPDGAACPGGSCQRRTERGPRPLGVDCSH
jgi:hypothetical protein